MSANFVRPSKYRHVYGQPAKKELCYENLKPTMSAFDSNILQANGKYLSLNANSIGAFTVIPLDEFGKAPEKVPMFRGHTGGSVLDTAFDPFDDDRIASCGDDGKILLWKVPANYTYCHADKENIIDVEPIEILAGHTRKVGHLSFNPVAKNVLASSSFDYSIKIWNLETKKCVVTLQQKDLITSFDWNYNGTQIVTASRDKKLRIWDARSGVLLSEAPGHTGAKATRVVWLGNTNRIATTGFDRFSERQLGLWNTDDLAAGAIGGVIPVDSSSGILMPFFDPGTNLLFLAGKGDGNVRYYEFSIENDDIYELSEYQSVDPQRGFAVAPKRTVNVKENEILKAYKLLNNNSIEPLSFIVPRRSEMFQEDIFPDAPAAEPALTADDFFAGKVVLGPLLCCMRDIYEGNTASSTTKTTSGPISVGKTTQPVSKPEIDLKTEEKKVKSESKEETQPVKEEEIKPVFTQSAEKGVETMLKEKNIDSLLNKVNDLSDHDDTQDVDEDNDGEWKEEKKFFVKPVSQPVSSGLNTPTKVETPVKVKVDTPVEAEAPVQVETPAKNTSTQAEVSTNKAQSDEKPKSAASGSLKSNIEKLNALVNSLETTVEKLTKSNFEKDEKLKLLEEKLDMVLSKL